MRGRRHEPRGLERANLGGISEHSTSVGDEQEIDGIADDDEFSSR